MCRRLDIKLYAIGDTCRRLDIKVYAIGDTCRRLVIKVCGIGDMCRRLLIKVWEIGDTCRQSLIKIAGLIAGPHLNSAVVAYPCAEPQRVHAAREYTHPESAMSSRRTGDTHPGSATSPAGSAETGRTMFPGRYSCGNPPLPTRGGDGASTALTKSWLATRPRSTSRGYARAMTPRTCHSAN